MWGLNLIISGNQTRELTQICQLIFALMYGDELQHVMGGGGGGLINQADFFYHTCLKLLLKPDIGAWGRNHDFAFSCLVPIPLRISHCKKLTGDCWSSKPDPASDVCSVLRVVPSASVLSLQVIL